MQVLITGGCGFIGSHVAERFVKEGHAVVIIDNLSTGLRDNVAVKHKFYELDVTDAKCADVFRIHNFDCIIHFAAQTDVSTSNKDAYLDSKSNILGLIHMLNLACRYNVKKFIFASSAAVYGDLAELPVPENAAVHPLSVYGINKSMGEYYCCRWKDLFGLETVTLRFANVYGPRQGMQGEAGVISVFMKQMLEGRDIVIFGDGEQTRDYVYVEDAVDAVYRSATQAIGQQLVNISTNTEYSLNQLLSILAKFDAIQNIRYETKRTGDIYRSRLDNTQAKQELAWMPKYSLAEGIQKTYLWYQTEWAKHTAAAALATDNNMAAGLKPYLENFAVFAVLILLSYANLYGGPLDFRLGFDYSYIYIAAMGFLYGKNQSLIAAGLSILLFTGIHLLRGGDLVAMMYQVQYLAHLAAYLCVGVVAGYTTDNKDRIIGDLTREVDSLSERYAFLRDTYTECTEIKDELYQQVVNSEDSLGKVYTIVRELDSLEIEGVYTAATTVFEKIMRSKSVAIYTVGKNENYLRLKTSSAAWSAALPKSLKIADHDYLRTIMTIKRTFVNRALIANCPVMAAPVVYDGRVIAIIAVYDMPFEYLTLYHEHLFKTVVMLTSDALTRAYLHDLSLQDKSYLTGTRILKPAEFQKILAEMEKRRELYHQNVAVLKLTDKVDDYGGVFRRIAGSIRAEDYVGLKDDGHIYILLLNIIAGTVGEVRNRLAQAGVNVREIAGEQHA